MPFFLFRRIFTENAGRFPHPGVFSDETRAVLLVTAYFPQKRGAFSSSRRVFCENAERFACFETFSAKTCGVFPVTVCFLSKRAAFSPLRSIFCETAVGGISAAVISSASMTAFSLPFALPVCRAVAPARRGRILIITLQIFQRNVDTCRLQASLSLSPQSLDQGLPVRAVMNLFVAVRTKAHHVRRLIERVLKIPLLR